MKSEVERKGPWSETEIDRFLGEARIPVRLAVNGRLGHPVIASLWFVHAGGTLWCAMQRQSRVAGLLERDPRCAFEIAPDRLPYHGVRGRALATLHYARGEEILGQLIDRYLGDRTSALAHWLLGRADGETAVALAPETLVSWDYRQRMGAA